MVSQLQQSSDLTSKEDRIDIQTVIKKFIIEYGVN